MSVIDLAGVTNLFAAVAVVSAIVVAYRWIDARSRFLAVVFATGVSVRVVAGLVLFGISLFQLPVLRSLQLGDGFWTLAPDGRGYYDAASRAVTEGLRTIPDG